MRKVPNSPPFLAALLSGLMLFAVACGGAQKAGECKDPDRLEVLLRPGLEVNPDREGNPRSVVVHVEQLDSLDAFAAATPADYWAAAPDQAAAAPDQGSAGPGLGKPSEVVVVPGRPTLVTVELSPKATYVAVLANFREPEQAWKVAVRLPPARNACNPKLPVMRLYVDLRASHLEATLRTIDSAEARR